MYIYSAVHEVACKPIFVFNVIFMDIGTCYWCMLLVSFPDPRPLTCSHAKGGSGAY